MSLDGWVQVGIWVSVCTVCPSLCCQSHSLCHTFVTPPAPLCSCFPSTPAGVFLLPFPCCPGSCPASLGLGSSLGMCSCCDALADGERGIPPYFGFLFLYPVGMSCSLCLCLALKMRNSQELLQERQDSWVPWSPTPSYPGNNGICAATFPKLLWQFRKQNWVFGHCVQMNDWKGSLCCKK